MACAGRFASSDIHALPGQGVHQSDYPGAIHKYRHLYVRSCQSPSISGSIVPAHGTYRATTSSPVPQGCLRIFGLGEGAAWRRGGYFAIDHSVHCCTSSVLGAGLVASGPIGEASLPPSSSIERLGASDRCRTLHEDPATSHCAFLAWNVGCTPDYAIQLSRQCMPCPR